jgi:leucyl-tRNA synthetase
VDQYIGGIEHAVLHLLYSRFFTKALFDFGLVGFEEPFERLFTQGMLIKDGAKMSKSRGNVVAPDAVIDRYGADCLRMYDLFIAPPEQEAEWREGGIEGIFRFLNRAWRAVVGRGGTFEPNWRTDAAAVRAKPAIALRRKTHQTVRRVTADVDRWHFNTAVSAMMELVNAMTEIEETHLDGDLRIAYSEASELLAQMLAPYAPHLAEELWHSLGRRGSVHLSPWPAWDEAAAEDDRITVVVQVNGKLRERLSVAPGSSRDLLEAEALASAKVQTHLGERSIRKVIVVPDRLVNIVTR